MLRLLCVCIISTISTCCWGQSEEPQDFGLKPYTIEDPLLGEINFFVTLKNIDQEKPLVIFLDGSGDLPLYSRIDKTDGTNQTRGSVPAKFYQLADRFHFVVISKPGVPFLVRLSADSFEEFSRIYAPSKEYHQNLSLDWRSDSASLVIDYLLERLPIKDKQVIAVGYSEGGQVVPKLALTNQRVTKIVNIVGGGLNQFYDFITASRLRARQGVITQEQAQGEIESSIQMIKEIYANPTATDKFWKGHTYKRWASFCNDVPLENMLQLDIPILVIAAGYDENSPITGIDYVELEFSRKRKQNLTYKVYPNCDHSFNDRDQKVNRLSEMIDYVDHWIQK